MNVTVLGGSALFRAFLGNITGGVSSFSTYTGRTYLSFEGVSDEAVKKCFGDVQRIITESEYAFVAPTMSEAECDAAIEKAVALGATLKSRIRLLGGAV